MHGKGEQIRVFEAVKLILLASEDLRILGDLGLIIEAQVIPSAFPGEI